MIDHLRLMQESSDTDLSEALTTCQVCTCDGNWCTKDCIDMSESLATCQVHTCDEGWCTNNCTDMGQALKTCQVHACDGGWCINKPLSPRSFFKLCTPCLPVTGKRSRAASDVGVLGGRSACACLPAALQPCLAFAHAGCCFMAGMTWHTWHKGLGLHAPCSRTGACMHCLCGHAPSALATALHTQLNQLNDKEEHGTRSTLSSITCNSMAHSAHAHSVHARTILLQVRLRSCLYSCT